MKTSKPVYPIVIFALALIASAIYVFIKTKFKILKMRGKKT